ncbi:hypothetical protein X961_4821 [Burkholderia pseudomallei MSHR5613]|nr:hypothetical protein X961_4821 [Burkholderia pseudomallei MSHR5613]
MALALYQMEIFLMSTLHAILPYHNQYQSISFP